MSHKPNFEENLQRLKNQYAAQLPEKISAITDDWLQIKNTWTQEIIIRLHRNVHSMIGTSGTFGFSVLSTYARELETALKPFIQAPPPSGDLPDIYPLIDERLRTLVNLAEDIHRDYSDPSDHNKK